MRKILTLRKKLRGNYQTQFNTLKSQLSLEALKKETKENLSCPLASLPPIEEQDEPSLRREKTKQGVAGQKTKKNKNEQLG